MVVNSVSKEVQLTILIIVFSVYCIHSNKSFILHFTSSYILFLIFWLTLFDQSKGKQ
jgi:hypothetical protein